MNCGFGSEEGFSWIFVDYIQFDVSAIPSTATILNATMKLYVGLVNGGTVDVLYYNVSSTWEDTTLIWNTAPTLTGSSVAAKAYFESDTGWISTDITSAVQQWVNNSVTNNGLMGIPQASADPTYIIVYFSKYSGTDMPKLEITYKQ
jgi:hypothetical protein